MKGVAVYSTFDVRLRAIEAVAHGMSKGQVATAYGIDSTTLYHWLNNYQHNGTNGVYRKEGNGRPTLLQELSETELRKIVLTSALSYGFESDLWTIDRLHRVITEKFNITVSKLTIWKRLVDAGFPNSAFSITTKVSNVSKSIV